MDTYMFILPLIGILIAYGLIHYVRGRGKNSKGQYAAAAQKFLTRHYPNIDFSDKHYVSASIDYNLIKRNVHLLVAYNDTNLCFIPIHTLALPPFYHIRMNDHHEDKIESLSIDTIKNVRLDRKGKMHITPMEGKEVVIKVGERNVFYENQHAEAVRFLAVITKAAERNNASSTQNE